MDAHRSSASFYVFRLPPKSDLGKSIIEFAKAKQIKAGSIVTCVGSLEQYNIRFANQETRELRKGFFEIVSLTGTFSNEACHLHVSVSDSHGHTTGGHLLEGSVIYTTAEITVVELTGVEFAREVDNTYGFHELVIRSKT